ncbi:CHY zinc finger protein [Microbacterium phosphatis]|uniref:CHY zinc finger protein n=1 Tax=Microbacterium phosphatis TaxID=3140248 RepID=UPI0031401CAC
MTGRRAIPAPIRVGEHLVHGLPVDAQTRCVHWATELDVLAILFPCCDRWYPCHDCHAADADHEAATWPASDGAREALLCGVCGSTSTIDAYRATSRCGGCGRAFNPSCARHHHLYFD